MEHIVDSQAHGCKIVRCKKKGISGISNVYPVTQAHLKTFDATHSLYILEVL